MNRATLALAIVVPIWLSGCAQPQTAPEFREFVKHSSLGRVDGFVANRPVGTVARTFRAQADRCLNKQVLARVSDPGPYGPIYHTYLTTYHPTLKVSAGSVELSLQSFIKGTTYVGTIPKDGPYVLVADAVQQGPNQTKVTLYHGAFGYSTILRAIKGWATGENVGCPDLTK